MYDALTLYVGAAVLMVLATALSLIVKHSRPLIFAGGVLILIAVGGLSFLADDPTDPPSPPPHHRFNGNSLADKVLLDDYQRRVACWEQTPLRGGLDRRLLFPLLLLLVTGVVLVGTDVVRYASTKDD